MKEELDLLRRLPYQLSEVIYQISSRYKFEKSAHNVQRKLHKVHRVLMEHRIDDKNLMNDLIDELSEAASNAVSEPAGRHAGYAVECPENFKEIIERFIMNLDEWDLQRTKN